MFWTIYGEIQIIRQGRFTFTNLEWFEWLFLWSLDLDMLTADPKAKDAEGQRETE